MKKIIVVARYTAYVPKDMTVEQVEELAEEELRNNCDGFRISVLDYHDEEQSEPLFDLEDVDVGTDVMLSVGGN